MSIGRLLFTSKRGFAARGASFGVSELRNPEREVFHFKRRLSLVAFIVFVAFCGLFGRFFYLQVVQHAHFETLAETNRIAIVPIVPNRGVITDRNGVVLAQSYSAYTLEITPSRVGIWTKRSTSCPRSSTMQTRPPAVPQAARGIEELKACRSARSSPTRRSRASR
jgi:hypothetical protein